jgi:hypothetical protein
MRLLCKVCCAALLACVLAVPASADIVVSVSPAVKVANVSDVFVVDIVADIPVGEAIIGWGMDFTIANPAVVSQIGPPTIGGLWDPAGTIDGDDLAAANFPPVGVSGTGIVLAMIVLQADAIGSSALVLSDDNPLDTTEGFVLADLSGFATVVYNDGLVIVPEPATLALLGFGVLALIRRRR